MISGSAFSKVHSSFWRGITPTTDLFVRRANLGQYERDFPEMNTGTLPTRRGFINEISFEIFCASVRGRRRWPDLNFSSEELCAATSRVRNSARRRDIAREEQLGDDPDAVEIADISEQHRRMMWLFTSDIRRGAVVLEPVFRGCGILDNCEGDVLKASTLYEVKAGERRFRSIDIRQLITYAALNHVSKQYEILRVGLFNPRGAVAELVGIKGGVVSEGDEPRITWRWSARQETTP